jgi:hypothetical protein
MKRGGSATVKNPVAKAVKKIKPRIVKAKKGKGSYNRKASSFSSGGAAKVRSAGKDYMASIRKRTPATGVKAKSRQQAMKEKIQKDANKSRRGFDSTPRQLEELKSGGRTNIMKKRAAANEKALASGFMNLTKEEFEKEKARLARKKVGGNVKKKVGKVVKALKKASKSHAGQAKTLSALKLREGGSTTRKKPKIKIPKGTKGFKGIQPLKQTDLRKFSKYESGGSANLRTGSKKMAELQKTKSGSQTKFNAPFASASPAEAREERARARPKDRPGSKKLAGDFTKTATAPSKRERAKDEKRVADIKRRQKTESAVRKKKSEISRKGRGGGGGRSAVGMGIRPPVLGPTRKLKMLKSGGKSKSRVNEAGNYTKPALRKRIFNRIKAGGKGGAPGQWSARKAQMMAQAYKKAGGGYRD